MDTGRRLLRLVGYAGLMAAAAWAGAATQHGNALLFIGCALGGTIAGFLLLRSAFRLGRSMRRGYDAGAPAGPSNPMTEAVKALGGVAAFAATSFGGFVLWSLLFVLFRRL